MADQCMVIAGEWKTSDNGRWTFTIDKHYMSKIVPLSPMMTLLELQSNVLKEFYPNTEAPPSAALSYRPPNTKELATGISTPPVMLTHDGQVAENLFPFTTPNPPIQKTNNLFIRFTGLSQPSTSAFKIPGFSLFDDEDFLEDTPIPPSNTIAPSKIHRFSLIDETISCADEMFKKDPGNIADSCKTEQEEENGSETELPLGFEDVQPRGYDHDFWDPLIDKDLGGSDVPEVMAGIHVPKTAPHIIHCTSSDAFDHTVLVFGQPSAQWKSEPKDTGVHSFPHVQPNPMCTSTPRSAPDSGVHHNKGPHVQYPSSSRFTPGSASKKGVHQRDIADEEFDTPPLFDDLSYEAEDVPDLNLDETDEETFVRKLYATKHDCQIGLAIYAIKQQFHFRQSRSTMHSFVLSCHDTHCDWRILAKKLTNCVTVHSHLVSETIFHLSRSTCL
ncbi:hypothetical protein Bca101_070829 [Brassica carinata]